MSRAHQYDQAVELYNMVLEQIRYQPPWRVNKAAVREAMQPIRELCRDTERVLPRLLKEVSDPELRQAADEFMGEIRRFSDAATRLAR